MWHTNVTVEPVGDVADEPTETVGGVEFIGDVTDEPTETVGGVEFVGDVTDEPTETVVGVEFEPEKYCHRSYCDIIVIKRI
jgi:hypothetical protein